MIVCRNCHHKNMNGALFCAECGAQLDASNPIDTQAITPDQIIDDFKKNPASVEPPSSPADSWLSLYLMDSGKVLSFSQRNEFTLGRLSEGQPIMPDIDLMPYDAYTAGVSRLHAVIKRDGTQVIIMDLGSSNGTYLNGRRLPPHAEEALRHGDIVALGKFKVQALLRNV